MIIFPISILIIHFQFHNPQTHYPIAHDPYPYPIDFFHYPIPIRPTTQIYPLYNPKINHKPNLSPLLHSRPPLLSLARPQACSSRSARTRTSLSSMRAQDRHHLLPTLRCSSHANTTRQPTQSTSGPGFLLCLVNTKSLATPPSEFYLTAGLGSAGLSPKWGRWDDSNR